MGGAFMGKNNQKETSSINKVITVNDMVNQCNKEKERIVEKSFLKDYEIVDISFEYGEKKKQNKEKLSLEELQSENIKIEKLAEAVFSAIKDGLDAGFAKSFAELRLETEIEKIYEDELKKNNKITEEGKDKLRKKIEKRKLYTEESVLKKYANENGISNEIVENYFNASNFLAYHIAAGRLLYMVNTGNANSNEQTPELKALEALISRTDDKPSLLNELMGLSTDAARRFDMRIQLDKGKSISDCFNSYWSLCTTKFGNYAVDDYYEKHPVVKILNARIKRRYDNLKDENGDKLYKNDNQLKSYKKKAQDLAKQNIEGDDFVKEMEKIGCEDPIIELLQLLEVERKKEIKISPSDTIDETAEELDSTSILVVEDTVERNFKQGWIEYNEEAFGITTEEIDLVVFGDISLADIAAKHKIKSSVAALFKNRWLYYQKMFVDADKANVKRLDSIINYSSAKDVVLSFLDSDIETSEYLYFVLALIEQISKKTAIENNGFKHYGNYSNGDYKGNETKRLEIINNYLSQKKGLDETNEELQRLHLRKMSPRRLEEMIFMCCLHANDEISKYETANKRYADLKFDLDSIKIILKKLNCQNVVKSENKKKGSRYTKKTIPLSYIEKRIEKGFVLSTNENEKMYKSIGMSKSVKDNMFNAVKNAVETELKNNTPNKDKFVESIAKIVDDNALKRVGKDGETINVEYEKGGKKRVADDEIVYYSDYLQTQSDYIAKYVWYALMAEVEELSDLMVDISKNGYESVITSLQLDIHPVYTLKSRVASNTSGEYLKKNESEIILGDEDIYSMAKREFLTMLYKQMFITGSFVNETKILERDFSGLKGAEGRLVPENIENIKKDLLWENFANFSLSKDSLLSFADIILGVMYSDAYDTLTKDVARQYIIDSLTGNSDMDRSDFLIFLVTVNYKIRDAKETFVYLNKEDDMLDISRVNLILDKCCFNQLDVKHDPFDLLISMMIETASNENLLSDEHLDKNKHLKNVLLTTLLYYRNMSYNTLTIKEQRNATGEGVKWE